ncbi:MAG: ABC transporter permease [Candidatus Promineifilaceae bacterium]
MRVFWSATKSSFVNFAAEYTVSLFISTAVPRYILQTVFFVLLARFAGGIDLMRFAFIGNVVQIGVNLGLSNMAAIVESEKWLGTLPILIAAPNNKLPALIGRGVAYMAQGLLSVLVALAGGALIFGSVFPIGRMLLTLPIIILIIITVTGLGLLIGAITLPTRIGSLVANTTAYIMMIICGVNFPVDALPGWLQQIAHILPVTNGLIAVRQVIDGTNNEATWFLLGYELLIGIIAFGIGYIVFEARLRAAQHRGTIELF